MQKIQRLDFAGIATVGQHFALSTCKTIVRERFCLCCEKKLYPGWRVGCLGLQRCGDRNGSLQKTWRRKQIAPRLRSHAARVGNAGAGQGREAEAGGLDSLLSTSYGLTGKVESQFYRAYPTANRMRA